MVGRMSECVDRWTDGWVVSLGLRKALYFVHMINYTVQMWAIIT